MIRGALVAAVVVALLQHGLAAAAQSAAAQKTAEAGVEILDLARQKVLVVELTVPPTELRGAVRKAVTKATNAARRQGLDIVGPPVVRYLERRLDRYRVEAGIPVQGTPKPKKGLRVLELPAGPAATLTHVGPYESLPAAHARLDKWLKTSGRKAGAVRWEVFVSNPVVVRDPAKLRTKLFVALE